MAADTPAGIEAPTTLNTPIRWISWVTGFQIMKAMAVPMAAEIIANQLIPPQYQ